MRYSLHLALIVVPLFGGTLTAGEDAKPAMEGAARAFIDLLAKKDFAGARKDFDDSMKTLFPEKKLEDFWMSLESKGGPFQKQGKARFEKAGKYEKMVVPCEFAKGSLDAHVVFDKERKITGLGFVPSKEESVYLTPPYVKKETFREVDVTVGSADLPLPGILSVPKGEGPFPVVVVIQGSGPRDRDGTMGPNQPYKDLAWGLASRQIAVLRFDKRTKAHPAKLVKFRDTFTVQEDVLDDALTAVALAKSRKEVDAENIYVLGHSLGGQLAPRIGAGSDDIKGLIVMAGNARPFEDLLLEQHIYLDSLETEAPAKEREEALKKIKEQVARVRDPKLSAAVATKDLPIGMPASYWLSLRGPLPPEVAKMLDRPMFILQGERDYQVTMEDFRIWAKTLKDKRQVTLKSYPALNHLFMEGVGKARPDEYNRAGHVAADVIEDIAAWVKKEASR